MVKLKLYTVSRTDSAGYDEYDGAVVAAPDEEAARNTHPNGRDVRDANGWRNRETGVYDGYSHLTWPVDTKKLHVEIVSETSVYEGTETIVVLSSGPVPGARASVQPWVI